ncbi:hypothetical protein VSX61_08815 [Brenneria populi subsp. brevivirga]|uniref:Virion structural protein n=1 Tax=Brenneria alni TaxID=71656 RepID=A0A421DNR7_9GAMM|nr:MULTISPECIES: hypothetical protein [Brenneria]MEC5319037.1 hypothetical protein [Brenneria populi subsp. brevivirga]RLM23662.1 hypothetical protein BIY29_10195 [Brenneria alni]
MSSAPFDVTPVIERLNQFVGADKLLRLVGSMAEYSKLTDLANATTPAAYVLLGRESPNDAPADARQSVTAVFGVVSVVRAQSSVVTNIDNARLALQPVAGGIRDQLIGWSVAGLRGGRPIKWTGGETLGFVNGVLAWMDTYSCQHFIGGGNA